MLVETPQILWNSEDDSKYPAALMSISMCESGIIDNNINATSHVLATAGNTNIINLWKITFLPNTTATTTTAANNETSASSNSTATSNTTGTATTITNAENNNSINRSTSIFQKPVLINNYNNNNTINNSNNNTNNNTNSAVTTIGTTSSYGNNNNNNNLATSTKIEYLCSLSRHDGPVNCIQFSPNGLHLATGGENGSLIIWSIPVQKRANNNGRHYWSTVTADTDLLVRVVSSRCGSDGICDLSWSPDSKRILIGTIDHAIICCEDESYDINACNNTNKILQIPSEWTLAYKNTMEHTHYVQGVAYDPQNVYVATMSSDRTVRILTRKPPRKSKITTMTLQQQQQQTTDPATLSSLPPPVPITTTIQDLLTTTKLDFIGKAKQLKYSKKVGTDGSITNKQYWYIDETTLESFVRRLAWTSDGAFLITPAALYHPSTTTSSASTSSSKVQYATLMFARHRFSNEEPYRVLAGLDKPSIAVRINPVLFQLPSAELSPMSSNDTVADDKENESPNKINNNNSMNASHHPSSLAYRSIFAVLTWDSVLIYDTYHTQPLSIIRGIHYAHIVDATWSADGHNLLVCSTDGYISIIRFTSGELGKVYDTTTAATKATTTPPAAVSTSPTIAVGSVAVTGSSTASASVTPEAVSASSSSSSSGTSPNNNVDRSKTQLSSSALFLPPCEPGPANILIGRPSKRAKTTLTQPETASLTDTNNNEDNNNNNNGAINNTNKCVSKRPAPTSIDDSTKAVDKLSLNNNEEDDDHNAMKEESSQHINKKQKKRIQPTLLAVAQPSS